jgi:regulator of sigma E protease
MNLAQTIIAFLVVLGVLIVVHELGHYLVARWCGVKVLRFSVGMGKVIFSRRFGPDQTEWAISILPFGGYVKMLDAREQDPATIPAQDLKREFTVQSVWRRMAIVAAGPIANFILAIALFAGLYYHGMPEPLPKLRAVAEKSAAYQAGLRGGELIVAVNGEPIQTWGDLRWKVIQLALEKAPVKLDVRGQESGDAGRGPTRTVTLRADGLTPKDLEGDFLGKLGLDVARPKPVLVEVAQDGPGKQAGLREGDLILEIDGRPIIDGVAFIEVVSASPGKPLKVHGIRNQQDFDLVVTPRTVTRDKKSYGQVMVGISTMPEMVVVASNPVQALNKAVARTWDTSVVTLKLLGKMLIGEVSWRNITGPITLSHLYRVRQHQSCRNEFATHSGAGWWTFTVLCAGSFNRTACFQTD